jgi:TPR repeat protein
MTTAHCIRIALIALAATSVHSQTSAPKKPTTQNALRPAANAIAPAQVEKAVLRVTCEGESAGAEVSINGEVKGQCPFDAEIPVGLLRIRATKTAGPDRERVFEKEVRLGSGVVQRVDVALGWFQTTAEAIKRWERAADAGDAEAMYQLGWAYQWGTAGVVDFVKSSAYYGRAAMAGHPAGMHAYSAAIYQGRAAITDREVAKSWGDKAVAKGDGDALYSLAIHYEYSEDLQEVAQSNELYARAAQAGVWGAIATLNASELDAAKKQRLDGKVVQSRLRRAEAGSSLEMLIVEQYYKKGTNGVSQDLAKAAALSRQRFVYAEKAAATGDSNSLVRLANYYRFGSEWNAKDSVLAEKLYREAIAKGDTFEAKRGLEALLKK